MNSSWNYPDLPPNIRALLQEKYPSPMRLAVLKITRGVQAFERSLLAALAHAQTVMPQPAPIADHPARIPRTDADVLDRDWHHDYYPGEYLPDEPPIMIWRHFARMVGQPLRCGPIESAEQVTCLRAEVAAHNQFQALAAANTPACTWPGQKLVLWRACWAILPRQKLNRRRQSGQLNVKLGPNDRT